MLAFPPTAAVSVWIDGRPLVGYLHAYVSDGRVFAPVDPMITRLADRIWFDGEDTLVIERAGRVVRVHLAPRERTELDATYVPIGPVLRALGDSVRYEPKGRRVEVRTPPKIVTSPTPFNPLVPSVAPSAVFTPAESPTPRPVWTGSPLPRRTPWPVPPPRAARRAASASGSRSG